MRQGAAIAGVGIAVGILMATLLSSALKPLVFGISPRDPLTMATVALALGGVAMLATWFPAWRASRVDAAIALRVD
jgi:ABC-type antimicrobial peptide transport system permease subunit